MYEAAMIYMIAGGVTTYAVVASSQKIQDSVRQSGRAWPLFLCILLVWPFWGPIMLYGALRYTSHRRTPDG